MQQLRYAVVLVTTKDKEEAEKIAGLLLKRRLAACVNIVGEVSSRYWWKDKLESAKESLLIIKTRETSVPDIVRAVKKVHSYEVPEIVAMPVIGGNKDYLEWIDSEAV